jgi:hypothetical protein
MSFRISEMILDSWICGWGPHIYFRLETEFLKGDSGDTLFNLTTSVFLYL